MPTTILVLGATGNTGKETIKSLLALDPSVHVLAATRDPSSSSSTSFIAQLPPSATARVRLVKLDLDVATATQDLTPLLDGVTGVYAVFHPGPESAHAQVLAAAAAAAKEKSGEGLKVAVLLSVSMTGRRESFPQWSDPNFPLRYYWQGKADAERIIKTIAPSWTIVNPSVFFSMFCHSPIKSFVFLLKDGSYLTALKPSTRLHLVADADIGRISAQALLGLNPLLANKAIPLATAAPTVEALFHAVDPAIAKRIQYVSPQEVRARKDDIVGVPAQYFEIFLGNQEWTSTVGYVDCDEVDVAKQYGVALTKLEDLLKLHQAELGL